MIQWKEFISWLFFGMLAFYGYSITNNIDKMADSVATLNTNVAVIISTLQVHEKRIEKLEDRKQ
jgi:arginine exporter protein ArgO